MTTPRRKAKRTMIIYPPKCQYEDKEPWRDSKSHTSLKIHQYTQTHCEVRANRKTGIHQKVIFNASAIPHSQEPPSLTHLFILLGSSPCLQQHTEKSFPVLFKGAVCPISFVLLKAIE